MKKIFSIIIGFFIFSNLVLAQANECMNEWSKAFDEIDTELLDTLEPMMKKNNTLSSELIGYFPQTVRTYDCELREVCTAIQFPEETNVNIKLLGCEKTSSTEVREKYSASLEKCTFASTKLYLQNMYGNCFTHARVKKEQMKIIIPELIRKDANRKKMAFIAYKLVDLNERLEEYFSNGLATFYRKYNSSMAGIKCIVKRCD